MDLTNQQWERLAPVFEKPYQGTGRPRVLARSILNGILWVLRAGAPWKDLPGRYPAYQTCHRRCQEWIDQGIMDEALQSLAEHLKQRGKIDVKECFIDGSFAPSKKEAQVLAKLSGQGDEDHGNYRRFWSSNCHRFALDCPT